MEQYCRHDNLDFLFYNTALEQTFIILCVPREYLHTKKWMFILLCNSSNSLLPIYYKLFNKILGRWVFIWLRKFDEPSQSKLFRIFVPKNKLNNVYKMKICWIKQLWVMKWGHPTLITSSALHSSAQISLFLEVYVIWLALGMTVKESDF